MALNQLGLGFLLTAKDAASKVFNSVGSSLNGMQKQAVGAGSTLELAGARIERVGRVVQEAGFAILGGLSSAVVESSKFGKAIAEVSTLVDTSKFSIQDLRDISLSAAQTFGSMPLESTAALYQAISGGANTAAKATDILTAANKLAIGGATDVATGVGALNAAMSVYSAEGMTATAASDALFVGMKKGVTTVGELATAMGRVLPVSQSMSISFDETIAAMSALTLKGINTNEAVTGLKAAFQNILAPTAEAEKAAEKLGITLGKDAVKAAGGLEKFLKKVAVAATDDFEAFQKVFSSSEALTAVLALTADGASSFSDIMEEMAKKGGATQEAFEKMTNTFDFQSDLLKSKLAVAIIAIGEAFTPVLKVITEFVSTVVDGFNGLPKPVQEVLVGFAALSGVLLVVAGTGLILLGAFAALQAVGPELSAAVSIVRGKFVGLMTVLGPLTLVAGAFFLLFKLNIGGFGDKVRSAVSRVMLAFKALGQFLSSGKLSADVTEQLNKDPGLKEFLMTVMNFVHAVKNFFTQLGATFDEVMTAAQPALDAFGEALDRLFEAFGVGGEAAGSAESRFAAFGAAGATLGLVLGLLLEMAILVVTPFIDLAAFIFEVIEPSTLLNLAMIALAAVMMGKMIGAIASLVPMIAGAITKMWAYVTATAAASKAGAFAGAAKAVAGGFGAIRVAANAALGPIGATTIAIGAAMLAWDQWKKLSKELEGGGQETLDLEIQRDLGRLTGGRWGISEEEYIKKLGIQEGDSGQRDKALRAKQASDKKEDERIAALNRGEAVPATGTAMAAAAKPAEGAAPASSAAAASTPEALAAAFAKMSQTQAVQQRAPTNINLKTTLTMDGTVLAEKIQIVIDADKAASGAS